MTDARPILEKILKEFEKKILSINQPMENNSFTRKASQKVKSSYVTSRNFSNFKRKSLRLRVNKIPSQEDLVKLATKLIREENRNTPNTDTNWPPTAAELLRRKAILPHLTEVFLKQILSSRTNQQLSTRRQNILTSIG